ncbi:MAG TPA: DUF1365 domain-containing protein [Caulobacteraceae bacterium]|jgi:hypothetical protein
MISALYAGVVVHERTRPVRRRLRYRVAQMLLDLDELPRLDRDLRWFGHNRRALFSFHDRDHGDGMGRLRGWITGQLAEAGCGFAPGAIRVLCMPRVFGHVFNPLSVFFCHDQAGRLGAVLYEVHNTFGERHSYVVAVDDDTSWPVRQHCDKAFYVSPFLPMALRYDFTLRPPAEGVSVQVAASDAEGLLLDTWFTGRRQALEDAQLLKSLAAFPLMTVKVVAAIRWEALKIWLSGVPWIAKPGRPMPAARSQA